MMNVINLRKYQKRCAAELEASTDGAKHSLTQTSGQDRWFFRDHSELCMWWNSGNLDLLVHYLLLCSWYQCHDLPFFDSFLASYSLFLRCKTLFVMEDFDVFLCCHCRNVVSCPQIFSFSWFFNNADSMAIIHCLL